MTGSDQQPVRSYQRIFKPQRRLYQVEGHRLPWPGGMPLAWLAYAIGALVLVIALSARSPMHDALAAVGALGAGLLLGGRRTALVAAAGAFGATTVVGYLLATLDWPLRFVVVPALLATLATQATPDGRTALRFAWSWLALQVRPERRSLGRRLPEAEERLDLACGVPVARDAHGPVLRRSRVRGPAVVTFAGGLMQVRRRGRRVLARTRSGRGFEPIERVELAAGERLQVRP